ncbi:MAG TPA: alpha/beta hydrolase [Xanthobacteraceae bacterium]|nr:alpha/beta hydrolase [Xanthobacteraceae bacterium]
MSFVPPTPTAMLEVPLDDGARIKLRRHGNRAGPRVLVTHGNGFAANAYFPYWRHLLTDYDLIVFDFRNHGENIPVEPSNHRYVHLVRDLERVVQAVRAEFGRKPTGGIFHSMSARTAMKHALEIGGLDALLLFDPPDVPPPGHPHFEPMRIFEEKLIDWARHRRRHFASVDELTQEYLRSRAARNWVAGAHALMARSVLRRNPDGDGFVLVCAPENEAAIYAEALTLNLWPAAHEFAAPVKLVGADPTMPGAPATGPANQALAHEGGYDYAYVAGAGHMLQIEKPEACIGLTLEFFGKCCFR